jgi:predicted metal-dependent enzyme (double-stranded beta helix superfamily)
MAGSNNPQRFRDFIRFMTELVQNESTESDEGEEAVLKAGADALTELIGTDDWLPDEYAVANPARYQQFLLHCDPMERFSVVSFVWSPGQETPIHDHCTWGLVGVLRGEEWSQRYELVTEDGEVEPILRASDDGITARRGQVDAVSPRWGDIHLVANRADEVAISIHVYGGNIGAIRRHVYDGRGGRREFVSGYVPTPYGSLWS